MFLTLTKIFVVIIKYLKTCQSFECYITAMDLGEGILKIISKTYEASSMVEARFKNYDLAFKTDEEGRPILLFLGRKDEKGNVKGERYARRLKHDASTGAVIKDHWEHKGKAT